MQREEGGGELLPQEKKKWKIEKKKKRMAENLNKKREGRTDKEIIKMEN